MTEKEKQIIVAEIERRISNPPLDEEYNPAYQYGLRTIRNFISSLPTEEEQKSAEKAKFYDWALKRARDAYKNIDPEKKGLKKLLENTFPELRESEDERIRKALLKKFTEEKNAGAKYEIRGCSLDSIISFLERQKEQKPAEYIKRNSKEWYSLLTEQYDKGFWKGKAEQKLAEWSEDIINRGIKEVRLTQHQIDWFKTNVFPPQQEWSEEDEKVIEAACALLCEYAGYYKEKDMEAKDLQLFKVSQRLKSLRPQPKPEWSEKDNMMGYKLGLILFDHAFSHGEVDVNGDITGEYVEIDNWLKSHKPQPKWKPTEEQLKALNKALIFKEIKKSSDDDISPLKSLYEQLKTL